MAVQVFPQIPLIHPQLLMCLSRCWHVSTSSTLSYPEIGTRSLPLINLKSSIQAKSILLLSRHMQRTLALNGVQHDGVVEGV